MCWSGRVCFGFPIRGGCVDMPTGAGCFPLVSVHVSVWLRRVLCFCLGVAVVSVVPDWLVCSGLGLAFVGTSGKALGGYVVAAGRCGCDPGGDGYNCGGGAFSHILPYGLIPCMLIPTLLGGLAAAGPSWTGPVGPCPRPLARAPWGSARAGQAHPSPPQPNPPYPGPARGAWHSPAPTRVVGRGVGGAVRGVGCG